MNKYQEILKLLSEKHAKQMLFLQFIFLVAAIFQVIGIASIAPFISAISNPDSISSNIILSTAHKTINPASNSQFLVIYALISAGLIIVSNAIASFSLWLLFRFSVSVGSELQSRLYRNYLNNQYIFFAANNSSGLIANLTQQIPRFVYMVLQPTLHLISQAFIAIIIIAGLIILDPILALISISVIGGIYFIIYWTVRLRMVQSGETVTAVTKKKLLLLNESINGIKEVKLSGVEDWYQNELRAANDKGLNAQAFIGLAGDIPKFIVETVVFISILILAIYLISTHGTDGGAITTLSFYAMAGYKILPAAQVIYKSSSSLKANGQVVKIIQDEMSRSETISKKGTLNKKQSHKEKPLKTLGIELINISYRFPSQKKDALKNLNLTIQEKKLTSFVGGSGAGKSTTIDVMLGLLTPSAGKIIVDGQEIDSNNIREWQSHIGYVPQHIFLLDDSILKNITFGAPDKPIDINAAENAAKKANIHEFICTLPKGYNTIIGEKGGQLSGGQRQRIGIARAIYQNPKILILDEATSALDTITERGILKEITTLSSSITVIMIAHRLSTIIDSDEIFVFKNGEVIDSGDYAALSHQSHEFQSLLKASEPEEKTQVLS